MQGGPEGMNNSPKRIHQATSTRGFSICAAMVNKATKDMVSTLVNCPFQIWLRRGGQGQERDAARHRLQGEAPLSGRNRVRATAPGIQTIQVLAVQSCGSGRVLA